MVDKTYFTVLSFFHSRCCWSLKNEDEHTTNIRSSMQLQCRIYIYTSTVSHIFCKNWLSATSVRTFSFAKVTCKKTNLVKNRGTIYSKIPKPLLFSFIPILDPPRSFHFRYYLPEIEDNFTTPSYVIQVSLLSERSIQFQGDLILRIRLCKLQQYSVR